MVKILPKTLEQLYRVRKNTELVKHQLLLGHSVRQIIRQTYGKKIFINIKKEYLINFDQIHDDINATQSKVIKYIKINNEKKKIK